MRIHWRSVRIIAAAAPMALLSGTPAYAATPDVQTIIEKSVEANKADFQAAPYFAHRETDRTSADAKTYDVTMIDGSPYQRLIAVNGKPLSKDAADKELRNLQQAISQRKAESSSERQRRIAKYQKDRDRDNAMMQQLTKAFEFKLVGRQRLASRTAYVLNATPKPGYQPPNMETQVLPGMRGRLWIDTQTFQWLKVTAQVIHPVSIEGFLAQVEPGTKFELEKMPVGDGIWQPRHFSMQSHAKVLYMFNRSSQEDDTFADYRRIAKPGQGATVSAAR